MQTHFTDDVSQLRPHAATGQRAAWARIHRPSICPTAQNWYSISCSINSIAWHYTLVPAVYTFACSHLECMLFD